MANTVVGFFDSSSEAQSAVEQLVQNGFSRESIDVTSNTTTSTDTTSNSDSSTSGSHTTDGENGITRFFKNLFGDNDEADRYSTVGQRSGAIVSVHTQSSDEAERAADLLDDYGAVNVDEKANEYGYASGTGISDTTSSDTFAGQTPASVLTGATSYDTTGAADTTTDSTNNTTTGSVIPIVQEELEVGKRTVQTGGVRVRSRIVERPVEESIRLREEKVTVERTPVNRAVTDADLSNFEEKSIELTETAEVPVVSKQARVVEEVRVSKDAIDREETIHDTVRNTEVDVENIGTKSTTRTTDADYDTDLTNRNSNTL